MQCMFATHYLSKKGATRSDNLTLISAIVHYSPSPISATEMSTKANYLQNRHH